MHTAIEILKKEGINIYTVQKGSKEEPRHGYVCTMRGSEVVLDENFFYDYTLKEEFCVKKNEGGYVHKSYNYSIIEKISGKEIFSQ